MYTVKKANEFITQNKKNINEKYRLKYHIMPDVGWMNDPNGVIYYKENYHVFYQYYPYGTSPGGDMHWGHAISRDLVDFRNVGVALAPDLEDETGIWSGGAEINNQTGELMLYYTKHYEKEYKKQTQNIATSKDGIHFVKQKGEIIGIDMLPDHASKVDFRDPNPVYMDGMYYILIGSKNNDDQGQILVYKSKDNDTFVYHGTLGPYPYFGSMAECPDLFKLGDKYVLLFSVIGLKKEVNKYLNNNSSIYMIGDLNMIDLTFDIDSVGEIDRGHDFYAPQTLYDEKDRRIMFAWMSMWDKDYVLDKEKHGWNGAVTFPRQLQIKENQLFQYPVEEIKAYHSEKKKLTGEVHIVKAADIEIVIDASFKNMKFFNDDNSESFELGYENGKVYFDSGDIGILPQDRRYSMKCYRRTTLRILMDISSIEIFIDGGRETITSRIYMDTEMYKIQIEGSIIKGEYHEIEC